MFRVDDDDAAAPGDNVERARRALGLTDGDLDDLAHLAAFDSSPDRFRLPDGPEADRYLRDLGVSDIDRTEILAARPDPRGHPELWWLLERCYQHLAGNLGRPGRLSPAWPTLSNLGAVGRFAYVWVFLAAVPHARRYHALHHVPDEVSWDSLGVVAAQMVNHRAIYGSGGLHTQDWMTHHFRGAVYALGRLHYERLIVPPGTVTDDGGPEPGDRVLGLHIPEGRLTPTSVDDSVGLACSFFTRHFPHEKYRYAVCTSWVLDPQLMEYLPVDSNIIRFQQRFTLRPVDPARDDSATVVEFLFKRPLADLALLPRATTLQRAVIDQIRRCRPWHFREGWFRLGSGPA
ncbi:acyltransferase domain-containing protein [Kribbella sancticallisti]|uniref:acyltransferase domain-containing protein n=1 Tax=Kribbella sancticallisti TaxID=460087 RepID=UPI0031D04919